jgi:hypothetical protein
MNVLWQTKVKTLNRVTAPKRATRNFDNEKIVYDRAKRSSKLYTLKL